MENDLITLSPASNDILILLSDGVIEEEDIQGNVIGYQAILHHLQKNQLKTPHEIINQIPQFIKMKTQSESFHDDLSIVAIQFL
jgi:serine phosphatase RsbU (regulator of sigma subunit)